MAAIRFFASGFRWGQNYPALRLLATDHTFDPENLPFFYCAGYPGTDLGAAGWSAPAQPELPVALDLPTHSYLPHVSFLPKLPACFFAIFAIGVSLFGTHCRTKQ
jgi:hypothetical protein